MPPRSLLHPHADDPLPLYTPRRSSAADPETSSIRSSAPSYVSEAPSYHSSAPTRRGSCATITNNVNRPNGNERSISFSPSTTSVNSITSSSGLPSSRDYAPGFQNRANGSARNRSKSSTSGLSTSEVNSLYNISEWVPVTEGVQARHYQNVANRRATIADERNRAAAVVAAMSPTKPSLPPLVPPLAPPNVEVVSNTSNDRHGSTSSTDSAQNTEPLTPATTSSSTTNSASNQPNAQPPTTTLMSDHDSDSEDDTPLSPHEDPHLVGEAAAALARSQRLYIARNSPLNNRRGYSKGETDAMRKQEAKTWDFMIAQMADWEERERSWTKFRAEVGRTRLLGRRLGVGRWGD